MADPARPRALSSRQRRDVLAVLLLLVGIVGMVVCAALLGHLTGALLVVFMAVAAVGVTLGLDV